MKRNYFWKVVIILFVTAWALAQLYPPTDRDLVQQFRQRASNRDTNFTAIVDRALELQKQKPGFDYGNLLSAIGTNDISRYFQVFKPKDELNPTTHILNRLQREAAGKIRLGIDLKGGTSFLLKMDTNQLQNASESETALSQAVEVLRKRIDKFGVAEPVIQPSGGDRILIQLPGLPEAEKTNVIAKLKQPAFLEFKLVHPQSDEQLRDNTVEPTFQVLKRKQTQRDGSEVMEAVVVKRKPEMIGGIKSATVVRGNLGEPEISFTLDAEGRSRFGEITRNNVGRRLAIVLDGQLYSAPVINDAIESGNGQITGQFDQKEAFDLAHVLENPLKAPLTLEESREVDPTLGKDSIRSGMRAAVIGSVAVVVFMLGYYLFAGVVATLALGLNILILLGVMCSVGTTLTLPGIAGIVLTIGMAVDANVLIFERIREELAAGKSMRGALSAGYDKAFGTIFDSNLTTLISSVILIFMGTGPVKGFGVSLTIGICVSMFTALVVTRLIFDWLLDRNALKGLKMMQLVRPSKFDFLRVAKPAFIASWILIAIGIGSGIYRGRDVFGVEFVGGTSVTMNFDKRIEVDRLRAAASKIAGGDVMVSYQRDIVAAKENLRITVRGEGAEKAEVQTDVAAEKLISALRTEFPEAGFREPSVDRVGPTVGAEIRNTAIYAFLLAVFGILIYVAFRFEFSFAVGAVVALLHDVLMTMGLYFLMGREVNATTVAAVLTIIGFSINDTIVIFDRIREDLKLGVRGSFKDVINIAVNQTISRTIITSLTVFLATVSLYVFGGQVINDFSFCFLVGIITGTYSSIFIASAIVLWWHKGHRPGIGAGAQVPVETVATARP
jgi:SecD/SecF fusion protein